MITLYARKKSVEPQIAVVGMSERIKGSLEMIGLHRELQSYDSAEIARAELGSKAEG